MKATERDKLTVREIQQLQRGLEQRPFTAGGRVLTNVGFTGGELRRIPHGLGRRMVGYLVVGIRDASALGYWDDEHDGRHSDMDKYAYITAHGMTVTADIFIF